MFTDWKFITILILVILLAGSLKFRRSTSKGVRDRRKKILSRLRKENDDPN